jgi:hypothetical protein
MLRGVSAQTVAVRAVRRISWAGPGRLASVVAARYLAIGALAVVLAGLHLKHRPASLCVLRTVTGIPCPLCGGTTAAVDLGHGNLRGALAASPFAVGLLSLGPLLSALEPPAWWQVPRHRRIVICAVLVVSEIWELVRFGIISF